MKALFLATSNLGKVGEFNELLPGWNLSHPLKPEFQTKTPPKVVEDGQTYFENALKKALRYFEIYQRPVLADDSGLEVHVLKGAPGVNTAYYGGEKISWSERWAYLWTQLRSLHPTVPPTEWNATFRAILCYYDGQQPPVFFEGSCEGKILPTPRGNHGFGYDPIFFSKELGKGFAEASAEEKNQASHRAKATRQFRKWMESLDHPESQR